MLQYYKTKVLYLFATLTLLCGTGAYAQINYDTIFTVKGFERDALLVDIISNIRHQPAELARLNALIQSKGSDADKWQMNLMNDIGYVPLPDSLDEKVIKIYEKHLALADKLENHYFQANIYFIIGEYYNLIGMYNESFQNKLYCLDELEKDPTGNYYQQSWWLHQIANAYYEFGDYKRALELSKVGFSLKGIRSPDPVWYMKVSSNLIGMSFLKQAKFDSAKIWFQKTYAFALQIQDTAWLGISTGNIGSVYFLQEKYTEAIPFYEKALPLCRAKKLWDNVAPFCCNLAVCYMETGKNASVWPLLVEAKKAIDLAFRLPNFVRYYSTLASYHRKNGDAVLALQSLDSLNKYKTKAQEEFNTSKKTQLEAQMAFNKKVLENEIADEKIKREMWIRYGLIITLSLLAIIGILIYKRQVLRHKFMKEHLENEKLNAELELSLAIGEIKDFTQNIKDKNEVILSFITEMEALKKQNEHITSAHLNRIEQLKQSADLTDEEWDKFTAVVKKAYPGYEAPIR